MMCARLLTFLLIGMAVLPVTAVAQRAPEQRCSEVQPPRDQPVVGSLVDSLAVVQALEALVEPQLTRTPISLLRLVFGRNGNLEEVEGYGASGPAADARGLDQALRPHLHQQPRARATRTHWLRVTRGGSAGESEIELSIASFSESCPAVLLDRESLPRLLIQGYQRVRQQRGGTGPTNLARALVEIRVDPYGSPAEVRMARSTMDSDMDAEILNIARSLRFAPARLDDYRVSDWIALPVQLRVR